MKVKFLSKLFFGSVLILATTFPAWPCRCVPASLKTYYNRAEAVVTARVLEVSTDSEQNLTASLEISDSWKKNLPKQIEVITGTSCIYEMQTGEDHLLYLRTAPEGKFSTMKCQGNLPLEKARKSRNWLNRYGKKSNSVLSSIFWPDLATDDLFEQFFEDQAESTD